MILLVDKPKGITSHDVIDRVRKITGVRKVGHAGTLDPMATGLLVVGIGRESTKKLEGIAKKTKKTYEAVIFLGEERTTDDSEGTVVATSDNPAPSRKEILQALNGFLGEGLQAPPQYSAIKIAGKKAYELARKGREFELSPRKITVYSLKLLAYEFPRVKVRCEVSSGTYIRSLARDLGRTLGTYGYLSELRRLRIGKYSLTKALKLDEVEDFWRKEKKADDDRQK